MTSLDTPAIDTELDRVFARFDQALAEHDPDDTVTRALDSLHVRTPGLFAMILVGFVGAIVNCSTTIVFVACAGGHTYG